MAFSADGNASARGHALRRATDALKAVPLVDALVAAVGAFLAIYVLAWTGRATGMLLLVAPFGASCVLVFALPHSPLAQPRNVIGDHLIATTAGLLVQTLVGATLLGFALGVALAVASMVMTRTTHPPAGADPIVVLLAVARWSFLATPILAGAVVIVLIGVGYHRFASGRTYPVK